MAFDMTDELEEFRSLRWLFIAFGLLGIAVGVVILVWPGISLISLAVVTGIFLLIDGVFEIVSAIASKAEQGRGLLAIIGALSVIAGLVMVKHPFSALIAFVIILGAWLAAAGVVRFVSAFSQPEGRVANVVVGAIDVIAGVVILAWPGLGLATMAALAGIIFILRGVAFSWGGWQMRKLPRAGAAATPAPAT